MVPDSFPPWLSGITLSGGPYAVTLPGSRDRVTETADETPICSSKGCRNPATLALLWNNPKIHTPDRRKTWVACDEHQQTLAQFLSARGFLRDTEPLSS